MGFDDVLDLARQAGREVSGCLLGFALIIGMVGGAIGALAFLAAGLLGQDATWLTIGIACAVVAIASVYITNRSDRRPDH